MDRLHLLVVDDDQDFAESLGDIFKQRGYRVELARSGEEAIARFRESDFDVTFMDVKLPGINGVESFLEIQQLKPTVRVVIMTAYSVEQLLDRAVENGAWAVLHKPLDLPRVLEMLENVSPDGILIADDDRDFVASVREMLESRGYVVDVAHDGRAALERISTNGIDVLILDLRMPVVGGLAVYLELKRRGRLVPTIIVTGYPGEEAEAIAQLKSLAVTGVLTKPFDPEEMLQIVERLTRKREE